MGDIIEFKSKGESYVERLCSECESGRFNWYTGEDNEGMHVIQCEDCGATHELLGEEVFD